MHTHSAFAPHTRRHLLHARAMYFKSATMARNIVAHTAASRHGARRLARIASHVVAAARPTAALMLADDAEAAFTPAEIIRRCIGLGATDEQLDDCVHQPDTEAALRRLADSLRPPPSTGVTVADLSVGRDASVEAIVERLDRYGACVIERLASDELIEQVEVQCTAAGAWDAKTIEGTGSNQIMERMCHEIITSAPSVATLLEQPLVLAAVSSVLCRSAKRVALKQVEVFELKPGQGSPGGFHREDQNWPWHHEPYPWCGTQRRCLAPLSYVKRSFAKTGSGQTEEKYEKNSISTGRSTSCGRSRRSPRPRWHRAHSILAPVAAASEAGRSWAAGPPNSVGGG